MSFDWINMAVLNGGELLVTRQSAGADIVASVIRDVGDRTDSEHCATAYDALASLEDSLRATGKF